MTLSDCREQLRKCGGVELLGSMLPALTAPGDAYAEGAMRHVLAAMTAVPAAPVTVTAQVRLAAGKALERGMEQMQTAAVAGEAQGSTGSNPLRAARALAMSKARHEHA